MGVGVAGLAVMGLGGLYIVLKHFFAPGAAIDSEEMVRTIEVLTGFSLGAESIALFARVGGGIYTIGAVLYGVGKKLPYFHAVFHVFVLAGSIVQFISVYDYVLKM